jgi:seryl-tRNA synthetase
MFDLKFIRDTPDLFDRGLARRGIDGLSGAILALDAENRGLITRLQEAQARRNAVSKEIGAAKAKGADAQPLIDEMAILKKAIQDGEERQRQLDAELAERLAAIPNLPADDVPDGADESANVLVRSVGEPPSFDFTPRDHVDLGEGLGLMDFAAAARMSGARFVVTSGTLARMERALGAFMLDLHTAEFGYTEVNPPLLVRDNALYGTGQLPKFGEDLFRTTNDYWLLPTSEVALTNLVREDILEADTLPRRYTALTPCFRSEAGAAGKDTRGMVRQHQFNKVELVGITTPEQSDAEQERMLACAEEVLKRLGLAYRVMKLCAGDMGFSARRTYDIEVWLPAQDTYREISSISTCGDFQARRMRARYRPEDGKGTAFVHTLNGSGLAVGRTLVAVMENYQQADGGITVPEALRPYMGGLDSIPARAD